MSVERLIYLNKILKYIRGRQNLHEVIEDAILAEIMAWSHDQTNCRTFFFTEKVTQANNVPGHVGTVFNSTALEDIPITLFQLDSALSHFLRMCGIVWMNIFLIVSDLTCYVGLDDMDR